jgi:hypothetical protein
MRPGAALRFCGGCGGLTTGTLGGLGHFLGLGFLTAEVREPREGFDGRNIDFSKSSSQLLHHVKKPCPKKRIFFKVRLLHIQTQKKIFRVNKKQFPCFFKRIEFFY